MINDDCWGNCLWTYGELQDATIECAWVDETVTWIGLGTIKAKERPNGDLKIDVICEDLHQFNPSMKVVSIPPWAFAAIRKHPVPDKAKFIIQN